MIEIENDCIKTLREAGFTVTKNGWPDILVEDGNGEYCFIEIKSATDHIRRPQVKMLQRLANLGLPVCIVNYNNSMKLETKFSNMKSLPELSLKGKGLTLSQSMDCTEKTAIENALKRFKNNKSRARRYLGLTARQLRYKLIKHNIAITRYPK